MPPKRRLTLRTERRATERTQTTIFRMPEATERKAETAAVFGRAAATYARAGPSFFPHFGRRLVEEAGIRRGDRVLDVACGGGAVALPARAAGADVTAIDLAPEMVERCRAEGLDARVMDGEQLEFEDGSFDAVLSGFGVFFFPDHERAFSEFHRVLRPGGTLGFTTFTDEHDPRWEWHEQLRPGPPADTPFLWTQRIDEILAAAAFVEPRSLEEDYELVFEGPEEWLAWKWSHGGRRELERKTPRELEEYRRVAFGHLAALSPIGMTIHARLTRCIRPR